MCDFPFWVYALLFSNPQVREPSYFQPTLNMKVYLPPATEANKVKCTIWYNKIILQKMKNVHMFNI